MLLDRISLFSFLLADGNSIWVVSPSFPPSVHFAVSGWV